jgi:hypothetical protein
MRVCYNAVIKSGYAYSAQSLWRKALTGNKDIGVPDLLASGSIPTGDE